MIPYKDDDTKIILLYSMLKSSNVGVGGNGQSGFKNSVSHSAFW